MPDPQWCESGAEEFEDGVQLMMTRGNHLQALVRFEHDAKDTRPWSMSVYDEESGECIPLNDGVPECSADNGDTLNACYPPRAHDALVQLSGPDDVQVDIPLTLEEEESAMCLIGSPAPVTKSPPTEPNPTTERAPDEMLIVVEAAPHIVEDDGRFFETTGENLEKFLIDERTNIPGALQDLKTLAERVREFGADRFYVKTEYPKSHPPGRTYLIFKGKPMRGGFVGRRDIVRSFGKYTFTNPTMAQLGFGTKNALKAGAKATVISFVFVAGIDVYQELLEDEVSLARLGITLAADVVKLAVSMLAGAVVMVAGTALAVKVAVPVVVIATVSLAVCLFIGVTLDNVDETQGVTEWLRKRAYELEKQAVESIRAPWQEFLWQMDWCIRHAHRCFGGYSL